MSGIGSELKELEGLSGGWRKYETAWAILIPNVPGSPEALSWPFGGDKDSIWNSKMLMLIR